MNVSTPLQDYLVMSTDWEMIHDLLGGTATMRAAGERWLPKEPKEQVPQYEVRLNRSFLFPALSDTIRQLTGKPFSREISLSGDLHPTLDLIEQDVDGNGTSLTQFGTRVFRAGLKYGVTHILVDLPKEPATHYGEEMTRRPRFIHVSPVDLIGWAEQTLSDGTKELTEVRIKESRTEVVNYVETRTNFIRVYRKEDWELWKEDSEGDWIEVERGTHSFNQVPLVTFYTEKVKSMVGVSPLLDLAWLNIAHWQSTSDQRNILRFARAGILLARGFGRDELKDLVIGPNSLVKTTNSEASLSWVEHSGTAIASGAEDIREIEAKMEILGMQPLLERSISSTATAKMIDTGKTDSMCQMWVRGLEKALEQAYEFAAKWLNLEIPEDFAVDIFNDFSIALGSSEDVSLLMELYDRSVITDVTLLREVKRRSVVSEGLDVSAEVELAQQPDEIVRYGKEAE